MLKWCVLLASVVLLGAAGASAQESNLFHIQAGTVLTGTEQFEVTKTADGYHVSGKLHTVRAGVAVDLTHDETLAADRTLVRYKLETTGQLIEAWREGDVIQMKVTVGGQSQAKSVPFTQDSIVLDNLVTAHLQVLLDRIAGSTQPAATVTAVVPQVMAAIPGKVSSAGEGTGTLNGKTIRVSKYNLQVANTLEELWAETGTNRLMRVAVPVQKVEIVREGFVLVPEPEPPRGPAAFVERPIEVSNGTVTLPGTLCLPAHAKGKVPLVVMVHGSGPNDRDETIGPNKPFRDLAHGLAAAGIGSLRYDKRTFALKGTGKLDVSTLTVEEETLADAVAAVRLARTLAEVDPARVFVLGHSQGAMFAPEISDRSEARGAILMAPAERPLDQVVEEQLAFQMKIGGGSAPEIETRVAELKRQFARVRSGEAGDSETVFGATARYWRDFIARDTVKSLSKTKAPVLLLQGGKDIQVTRTDYEIAQRALASRPSSMREEHLFPDLNHLFIAVEGEPTGAEYGLAGHVAPEVIRTIADWIAKQA
jgi:pimeloyl-ACP methyl ester carboxylesterase